MIETIRDRFDETQGRMRGIEDLAAAESRDELSEAEQATWDELRAQAETYAERLTVLASREELDQRAAATLARITRSATDPPAGVGIAGQPVYRSPGEYAMDYMRMQHGDHQARSRLQRALTDVTTSDAPGLVPPQVIGPLIGQWLTARPTVNSFSHPTLPAVGMEVQRPHILQHVIVGQQTAEKTQVASGDFKVDLLKCDLQTWAGAVDVSWQLVERASPAAIDLIFSDFAAVYARASNNVGATIMANSITNTGSPLAWDGTAANLMTMLAEASVLCAQQSVDNMFPDTVWLGLNAYAAIASLVDTDGRPIFPNLAPQNAPGTSNVVGFLSSLRGLNPVIDPFIDPNTFIVGDSTAMEFYENADAPVRLSVLDVGVLGYNIGVAGMFSALNTDPGSFVKVTFTPIAPLAATSTSKTSTSKAGS
jgi:HK97 family phage major capsid protein